MPDPTPSPSPTPSPEFTTAVCSTCGAHRPKEEIDHRNCQNCANLDQIKAQFEHQSTAAADNKAASDRLTETLKNLPDLDKPASSLYDNERGVWWFGVNLREKEIDLVGLLLTVDQSKAALIAAFLDWKRREAVKAKIILPRMQATVNDVFKSAREKAGAARTVLTDKVRGLFEVKL